MIWYFLDLICGWDFFLKMHEQKLHLDSGRLGCCAMSSSGCIPAFRGNILPASSGYNPEDYMAQDLCVNSHHVNLRFQKSHFIFLTKLCE
jgi:hypothetical protein